MSASIRLPVERSYSAVAPPVPPLSAADRLREHRDRAKEDCVNLSRLGMSNHENLGWCLIHCKRPIEVAQSILSSSNKSFS